MEERNVKIKFLIKFDEDLGIIYEYPICKIEGWFDDINDLNPLIEQLSLKIKHDVTEYINNKVKKKREAKLSDGK